MRLGWRLFDPLGLAHTGDASDLVGAYTGPFSLRIATLALQLYAEVGDPGHAVSHADRTRCVPSGRFWRTAQVRARRRRPCHRRGLGSRRSPLHFQRAN
jgi:hypothetical protein